MVVLARPLLSHVLDDDALTRGLGDEEARMLVEWLVERAEALAETAAEADAARRAMETLCRRARAFSRFVGLWCHRREQGAAHQLAAAERFHGQLPSGDMDACELMEDLLLYEDERLAGLSILPS